MTIKELRTIINNPSIEPTTRIFMEYPIGPLGYVTSSVEVARIEQDPFYAVLILSGCETTES